MKSGNLTESGSWNDRRSGLSLGRGTVEAGSQLPPNPTSETNPECLKLYRPVPADRGRFSQLPTAESLPLQTTCE
jgi:hypothetical protein